MNYTSLSQAEHEIQALLERNRSNWQAVAKIAIAVRENRLHEQSGLSYTAWVQQMAERCDCQKSLIWRYIKAAKYYLQTVGSDEVEQIDDALAAPEALINLEKVERHAPELIFQGLKQKVLDGAATVRECRSIARQYKPISENRRGRPPTGTEGTYEHLGRRPSGGSGASGEGEASPGLAASREIANESVAFPELDAREPTPPGLVAKTIAQVLAKSLVEWTKICLGMRYPPRHHITHTEVRVSWEKKRLRFDCVSVIRWSNKKPKSIFVIEIKSSLADFEQDHKWQKYLQFCDYFCFALPASEIELIQAVLAVQETINSGIGILVIDIPSESVQVLRSPRKLDGELKYLLYETLYERALGWSGSEQFQGQASQLS